MDAELYIERIEQYESGAMSEEERRAFESELQLNAALRQTHAAYLQANEVIEQGIENKLRSQFNQWADEAAAAPPLVVSKSPGTKVVSMKSTWTRLAIAASVALLIGWFGWQWAGSQYSDAALYAGYYEKPGAASFRDGAGTGHPLQQGFDLLSGNKFDAAARFFESIPADSSRYAEAQYFLGHASLQLKNHDKAIAAFGHAAEGNDARFRDKAEWNLLLTYLDAGRTETPDFKMLLERISANPAHSYTSQAKALAGKLNAFWRKAAE